jgi:asparagine synthase (glutamine-hydrolysing)
VDSGWFDRVALDHLVTRHLSGRSDHSATLWKLLMLEAFLRRTQQSAIAAVELHNVELAALAMGGVQE